MEQLQQDIQALLRARLQDLRELAIERRKAEQRKFEAAGNAVMDLLTLDREFSYASGFAEALQLVSDCLRGDEQKLAWLKQEVAKLTVVIPPRAK